MLLLSANHLQTLLAGRLLRYGRSLTNLFHTVSFNLCPLLQCAILMNQYTTKHPALLWLRNGPILRFMPQIL